MAIKPEQLHCYATGILHGYRDDAPGLEPLLRTSISRNYYAVIIKARGLVHLTGGNRSIHAGIRKQLNKLKGPADVVAVARKIAANLKSMPKQRNLADYRFDASLSLAEAVDFASKARKTLQLMDQMEEMRQPDRFRDMPLVFTPSEDDASIIRFSVRGPNHGLPRIAHFCPRKVWAGEAEMDD